MIELQLISEFYGNRTATRSGVPLINHIHDGLAVLRYLPGHQFAQRAFCLHPMFQSDEELGRRYMQTLPGVPQQVMTLVMEYRSVANSWLSNRVHLINRGDETERAVPTGNPNPGPLPEVRHMLIADKVQNYKDFQIYHQGHPRKRELAEYFFQWFHALGVSTQKLEHLSQVIYEDRVRRLA